MWSLKLRFGPLTQITKRSSQEAHFNYSGAVKGPQLIDEKLITLYFPNLAFMKEFQQVRTNMLQFGASKK